MKKQLFLSLYLITFSSYSMKKKLDLTSNNVSSPSSDEDKTDSLEVNYDSDRKYLKKLYSSLSDDSSNEEDKLLKQSRNCNISTVFKSLLSIFQNPEYSSLLRDLKNGNINKIKKD